MKKKVKSGQKKLTRGNRAFWICMWLFWIGVLTTALIVTFWIWLVGVDTMQRGLAAAKPYIAAWRLLLFAILIGGWRWWSALLVRWARLNEERHRFILAQRWRVAAWLVVIEVVVVQGVAGTFIANLVDLR